MKEKIGMWIRSHKVWACGIAAAILAVFLIAFTIWGVSSDVFVRENHTALQSSALLKVAKNPEDLKATQQEESSDSVSDEQDEAAASQVSEEPGKNKTEDPAIDTVDKTQKATSASENKSQEPSKGSSSSAASQSGTTSKSQHQHNWKAHTATRWVSNWVTVVDVPETKVEGAQLYTEQADGTWLGNGEIYWFENGFTIEDLKDIIYDKMLNENYIGNYVNRQKIIPAQTHQEDHGHTETYTDYYYCDCGAKK